MEILDKEYKKQTTRVYFGVPLYYWIGAVAFVVMNQVNLLYWNPEILEFLVLEEIEDLWFDYGVEFIMITHFPLVVIFIFRAYFKDGVGGFFGGVIAMMLTIIMSFFYTIAVCICFVYTCAFFYLPIRFIWLHMYDGNPILESRLTIICMQFIAALLGVLVVYKTFYKLTIEEN